jgi:lactoylglutathione lyase
MQLEAFSVSLAVKDLSESRAFYEKLGFSAFGGDSDHGFLILRNGETVIGLFQGMFEKNILPFNPGWDSTATPADPFTDLRELLSAVQSAGITPDVAADPDSSGPASFVITDPDDNQILIDQHR